MGIINVTPDSFSDGGRCFDTVTAVDRGVALVAEGASILDVGGESTRPGAEPVSAAEEIDRVVPVVEALVDRVDVPISIDTTKLEVAREAVAVGAAIVNDISGLRFSPGLAELAARHGTGLILMHMLGEPRTMQRDPRYDDVLGEIGGFLKTAAEAAIDAGVAAEAIVVDPGIGFGKTAADNDRLLARLDTLLEVGYPVLIGHSRKTFLDPDGSIAPVDRVPESIAAGILAALGGASILRVHDVAAHARALAIVERIVEAGA